MVRGTPVFAAEHVTSRPVPTANPLVDTLRMAYLEKVRAVRRRLLGGAGPD